MKRIIILLFSFGLFAVGCGTSSSGGGEVAATAAAGIAMDAVTEVVDPVCGMNMRGHTITDTLHLGGKVYPFCAPGCAEKFQEDPSAYVSIEASTEGTGEGESAESGDATE